MLVPCHSLATVLILGGMSLTLDVLFSEDPAPRTETGMYVYCKDRVASVVLFGSTGPEQGTIFPGSVNTSQEIICDWVTMPLPGAM